MFAQCGWWQEQYLLMQKRGCEFEVGRAMVNLEFKEEENGYTKKVYQVSNRSTGTGHNVSLSLF